jgi:lysozyme
MINDAGKELIKSYEGLRLKSYKCSAGKDSIGFGNTFYEDGRPVKPGDTITIERAHKLFDFIIAKFSNKVSNLVKTEITDNQKSALVSFAYNCGITNLMNSTLLKKVNVDPSDPSIADEFKKWTKAGGKSLPGLAKRREAEAKLYFT